MQPSRRPARANGTVVSFDLNYRESLWRALGGSAAAQRVLTRLVASVDVLVGNEEDFVAALGLDVAGVGADRSTDSRRMRTRRC